MATLERHRIIVADGQQPLPPGIDRETVLRDYRICWESRHASLLGRREVLTGKAKFGIFGDGKEVAQVAMAKAFRPGDWRSGYYRDQTLLMALGLLTLEQFFAQLYAHADEEAEPASAGRQMNCHFGMRLVNPDGSWRVQTTQVNIASDISPTGSQMPRLVGLAYASRLYRELPELRHMTAFSNNGEEIAWGTIGNATCAEGMFWEAVNAIGVLRAPAIISIWDDGYGISVPNEYQVTKGNISALLEGFRRTPGGRYGFDLYVVRGWDYPALVSVYQQAAEIARREHVPAIVHVIELTQPQGHSTSGSHERYKTPERLQWEREYDCLVRMRQWILEQGLASAEELDAIERAAAETVRQAKERAWRAYQQPILEERAELASLLQELAAVSAKRDEVLRIRTELLSLRDVLRRDLSVACNRALIAVADEPSEQRTRLVRWRQALEEQQRERYSSHLYSQTPLSALRVPEIPPQYREDSPLVNGFEVINACFDAALRRDPRVVIFGEDVGRLGDVNQGCAGLQAKYGELRVSDTGIRECTIVGQAIGLALRGLRPIAEIQYLDYLLYALQIMSDDIATFRWRTKGAQAAPVIIRTRGHRLEGVWHSGSPMAGILNLVRGMLVLVPRDMTRAAGFYNTVLRSDDPALIVEVLNGYRLKERLPANIGEFTVPVGVPEILREGSDITIVTYGACCRIALEAAELLARVGVSAEVIDVQSLVPFDIHHRIVRSLQKTNRILFVDEDVPGGTTAYMMQQVLEVQGGYRWLDAPPRTLPGAEHRPAYGSDGDYWSKPNAEQIFEAAYELMHESNPSRYPLFFR